MKENSNTTSGFDNMSSTDFSTDADIREILELMIQYVLFYDVINIDPPEVNCSSEKLPTTDPVVSREADNDVQVDAYLDNVFEQTDDFDPRVTVELDILNQRNDSINKLELELDDARRALKLMRKDHEAQLMSLETKIGSAVKRSLLYYETLDDLIQASSSLRNAVSHFERVQTHHLSVKEYIDQIDIMRVNRHLSPIWEKTLSDAIERVQRTKMEMIEIDKEVQHWQVLMEKISHTLKNAEKGSKRTIKKARPYYDKRKEFIRQEKVQQDFIRQLENCVSEAKNEYHEALKSLEMISEEIHKRRLQSGNRNSEERTSMVSFDNHFLSSEGTKSNTLSNDMGFSSGDENSSYSQGSKSGFRNSNSDDTIVST